MSRAALKRVEARLAGVTPVSDAIVKVRWGDLRAVLALAKQAAELKRRLRAIRRQLSVALGPFGFFEGDEDLLALLDLRRPLKRGKK